MSLLNKTNGLRVLLTLVVMLLLFNLFLNHMGSKTASSLGSKLRLRSVHNASHKAMQNISKIAWPTASLVRVSKRFPRNTTVVPKKVNPSPQSTRVFHASLRSQKENVTKFNAPQKKNAAESLNAHAKKTALQNLTICQEPALEEGGPIFPNTTLETLDVVEARLGPLLQPGGVFTPADCIPRDNVAIVVPFRDRYAHLSIFLRNIHPFLMRQHIAYRIFVIEQTNGKAFNRAALMNIGFLEALKIFSWDCFIFHDVDLLPLDDRNLYNCPRQPRHMSVSIDTLNFKLPYRSIFGGVSAMTRAHFQAVNGFSNSFFGWGGEDDDMSNRLKHANLFISRYPVNVARYKMLKHAKEKANPKRYENLVNGISKMQMDGLNSIKYEIYSIRENPTFTWYLTELKISDQKS